MILMTSMGGNTDKKWPPIKKLISRNYFQGQQSASLPSNDEKCRPSILPLVLLQQRGDEEGISEIC